MYNFRESYWKNLLKEFENYQKERSDENFASMSPILKTIVLSDPTDIFYIKELKKKLVCSLMCNKLYRALS